MALLELAMQVLENIEQRRYGEALHLLGEEARDCIILAAPDLIYKVAYSFGNQENVQLRLLLIRLLKLLTSVQQKFEIIYELLTLRSSLYLTEVLMDQLHSLINDKSLEACPKLRDQICNELPLRLEKRLCERLIKIDEESRFTIREAAVVLGFFAKFPVTFPYKFDKLVDSVLCKIAPDESAAYPFLVYHARDHPFSPRLLGHMEPTPSIPHVYELQFLRLRIIEGICEYIKNTEQQCDDIFVKPLTSALRFLHDLCSDCHELHERYVDVYAQMFVLLGLLIEDENSHLEAGRSMIMRKSQLIMACFPVDFRVLLLKRILERMVDEARIRSLGKPKFLVWLLDLIEQNMSEKFCSNEMGSIFGLLECLIWKDVPSLTGYYSAVLRIINAYSQNCFNVPLLEETKGRLVIQIRNQLLQYLQHDNMIGARVIPTDNTSFTLQSVCCPPACQEESDKQLQQILETCERTIVVIDKIVSGLPCS